MRISLLTIILCFFAINTMAQKSRQELEKETQQYKKEMQDLEKLVKENKSQTNQTYAVVKLQENKINLQEKVINNISRDINVLDDNIYTLQKDVNKYDKVLDTLKQEYAKSMVYAYKNRSNYDFLNFVFSASSFNDAIKRVAYLKSYREYREMQGENILRTQELRRKRIEEITGVKQTKNKALESKNSEIKYLEQEKQEQDKRLAELKKNGSQIAAKYADKKRQMKSLQATIAKLIKEEIRIQREKDRLAEIERKKELKRIKDAADAKAKATALAERNKNTSSTKPNNPTTSVITKTETTKTDPIKKDPVITTLPSETSKQTSVFVNAKGGLPWPVSSGQVILHFGKNELGPGNVIVTEYISIATEANASVKSVFNGVVSLVQSIDGDAMAVLVRHGEYFTSYSNIGGVTVKVGQQVSTGQVLGKTLRNPEGQPALDFMISNERGEQNPEQWLQRR